MIIDTSALVTIFADEPERARFMTAISESDGNLVSGGSWVEFGTVLVRRFGVRDPDRVQDGLVKTFALSIRPVTATQVAAAVAAYATFGRGAGHRAKLNFGDCFAYALASQEREPLLFKGDDFNHTDLLLAAGSAYPR